MNKEHIKTETQDGRKFTIVCTRPDIDSRTLSNPHAKPTAGKLLSPEYAIDEEGNSYNVYACDENTFIINDYIETKKCE